MNRRLLLEIALDRIERALLGQVGVLPHEVVAAAVEAERQLLLEQRQFLGLAERRRVLGVVDAEANGRERALGKLLRRDGRRDHGDLLLGLAPRDLLLVAQLIERDAHEVARVGTLHALVVHQRGRQAVVVAGRVSHVVRNLVVHRQVHRVVNGRERRALGHLDERVRIGRLVTRRAGQVAGNHGHLRRALGLLEHEDVRDPHRDAGRDEILALVAAPEAGARRTDGDRDVWRDAISRDRVDDAVLLVAVDDRRKVGSQLHHLVRRPEYPRRDLVGWQ